MKLLVIRHGESEADILKVHEGRADFPLTNEGKCQAAKMARYIAGNYHIDKIYSSTLLRARQTAMALQENTGVMVDFRKELMEFDNGYLAGLSKEEAMKKYPEEKHLPLHKAMYGMESMLEFRYRAEYILSSIVHENAEDSTIAIISHGGMINQLYRSFLKLPNDSQIYYATGDTGIHCWSMNENKRYILYANRLEHLGK